MIAHDLPGKSRAFGRIFHLRIDDFARGMFDGDDRQTRTSYAATSLEGDIGTQPKITQT